MVKIFSQHTTVFQQFVIASPLKMGVAIYFFIALIFISVWGASIVSFGVGNVQKYPKNSIYNLSFEWIDENGEKGTLSKFEGRPVILSWIYTTCKGACPLIMEKMKNIEKKISQTKECHYVLITMDPKLDTISTLLEFKKLHKGKAPHWHFLSTSVAKTREFSHYIGFNYKKISDSDHFMHDNVIYLLDEYGVVIKQINGLNSNEQELVDFLIKKTLWERIKSFFYQWI
ncbi:MAG: SCO family protein [Deltaproteobacteria bacterium]|nr:SCO family protein [Deltaproteobacteria bacterium]